MGQRPAVSLTHRVLPARQAVAGPPPGLLLLHGRGADELDLLGLADALDPRLVVISARAPFLLGPGYHWYHLVDIGIPEPASYAAAHARLARFVGEIVTVYGLDPARLFGLGFSQGAVMTGGLMLDPPPLPASRLAGAVLLSGYLPPHDRPLADESGLRNRPVFVAHGRRDSLIPAQYGRQTRDALTRLGAAVTYREYPIEHAISPDELADMAAWLTERLG